MDYKKKYNEALAKAKDMLSHKEVRQEDVEYLFPELKESEDERIRKVLCQFMEEGLNAEYVWHEYNVSKEQIFAWLEKQGKEEYALKSFKDEDVRKFMQYIEKQAKAYELNLPNRGYDIYAFAKDILAWLEKRGEKKSQAEREAIKEEEIDNTNKVELKFKVGDYIKHNKANIICKIISVNSGSYYVENIETNGGIELFNAEQNFHLWTINDAKDTFIEKACQFIEEHLHECAFWDEEEYALKLNTLRFIEDFKKYMKGE